MQKFQSSNKGDYVLRACSGVIAGEILGILRKPAVEKNKNLAAPVCESHSKCVKAVQSYNSN
jgi:hypothetical protein